MKYNIFLLVLFLSGCRSMDFVRPAQTINVNGYSEIRVKPDISIISLNASARSDTKSAVMTQMNEMVDSVITELKANKVKTEEVIINNLNIYWNYIHEEKDKERRVEYSANQNIDIRLKFDINEIEKVVQIVRAIPRLNFNINFDLSKPRRDSLENVVSRMAITDAREKAANIAAASGLTLIKILNVTYQSNHPGAFSGYNKESGDMAFATARTMQRINLEPREIEMNDNVQFTFLVRNMKK